MVRSRDSNGSILSIHKNNNTYMRIDLLTYIPKQLGVIMLKYELGWPKIIVTPRGYFSIQPRWRSSLYSCRIRQMLRYVTLR